MKYYYGDRGSGKTTKLLKEAVKAVIDGKTVIFVAINKSYIDTLKYNAVKLFGEELTNKINFLTYKETKDFIVGRNKDELKVFIDETQYVLAQLLFGMNRNIDVTMSLDTDSEYSTKIERKR